MKLAELKALGTKTDLARSQYKNFLLIIRILSILQECKQAPWETFHLTFSYFTWKTSENFTLAQQEESVVSQIWHYRKTRNHKAGGCH